MLPPPPPSSRLTGLSCSLCGHREPPEAFAACPACRAPLLCDYELRDLASAPFPATPPRGGMGVFRWGALLPVRDPARRLTLGEGDTPVVDLPQLAQELGLARLRIKDEAHAPGGAFKARGLAVGIAAHVERGATSVVLPSAGNAGSAAAAYSRRHGIACRVVLPTAATPTFRLESRLCGARVIAVSGDLGVAGEWVRSHPVEAGDHVVATFAEPFRVEGKKTMGYEIWESCGGSMPEVVAYPTGGGVGLVAMHRAWTQLAEAGLMTGRMPRLLAAQVDACAPVVRAWQAGAEVVEPWEATRRTLAEGLRVPKLGGGRLVMRALRETNGMAHAVSENQLIEAVRRTAAADGLLLGAEGAVAIAAIVELRKLGQLEGADVLAFNTASAYKSPETLAAAGVG